MFFDINSLLLFYTTPLPMFLWGAMIGSFLHVFFIRTFSSRFPFLIQNQSFYKHLPTNPFFSFSQCPQCKHSLHWYDNIPLLSWIMLRARCRYCASPIPIRYFLYELFYALIWLLSSFIFVSFYSILAALFFTFLFSLLTFLVYSLFLRFQS